MRWRPTLADADRARRAELEAAIAASLPRLSQAQETWFRLSGLRDRFRATAALAAERVRRQAQVDEEDRRVGGRPRRAGGGVRGDP